MLAELTGNIHIGLAFGGAAIGIGIATAGGVMAMGRNPGMFGKVFTFMLSAWRSPKAGRSSPGSSSNNPVMIETLASSGRCCSRRRSVFPSCFSCCGRYAYKPIFNMLEARREKIAEGIANAEKIKAELAKTEAERQKILADAGDHGQQAD